MNKAKIKSNLVSFGVAILVALVICAAVVAVHFLTPQSSASAEVSTIDVGVNYINVVPSSSLTVLSSSSTSTLACSIYYQGTLFATSYYIQCYNGNSVDMQFKADSNTNVHIVRCTYNKWYIRINNTDTLVNDGDLVFKFSTIPSSLSSKALANLKKCLSVEPTPWPSVLPPNTNADDVTTSIVAQTDYYNVESYFTASNSDGDYDIGAGVTLDNTPAAYNFTVSYGGVAYNGSSVKVYYREDTSIAKALTIITFEGTSPSDATITLKCWSYETLISNVYTTYNYWTNAVDDSVKLADYSVHVVFWSLPSSATDAGWIAYGTLGSGLTDTLPSSAPTFGSSVAVNFVTWYSKAFSDSTITQLDLVGYEVTNASDYLVNGTCRVDVKLITNENITSSDNLTADDYLHIDNVLLYPINGKYYLILSCTQAIKSIRVNFVGQSDFATIGTGLQLSAYIANGTTIEALKNFSYNEGRAFGYNQGYEAGASNENNLMSLIWYTFELPFKIMFGTYDNNQNSPTYQQYVGGLFNFEFLGLDIRAFVLSVISVCLIIAIIKLILGNRGGSNG